MIRIGCGDRGPPMSVREKVPARFPEKRSLQEDVGLWWVLHTKPNCERMVARYLLNRDISYYLPLYEKKMPYGNLGRIRIREVPVFSGYLCFALDRQQHRLLYETKKFVRIIKVDDQEAFVKELEAVAQAVESYDDIIVHPGLVPGRRVLILSGPMAGVEGLIVRRDKKKQLALQVQMFNQTVLVKLDPFTKLEPFIK